MPASTVLLLGSDAAAREEIRAALVGAGYEVTEVADGAEAIARAPDHQLLVIDAVESGQAAFCRAVREDPATATLAMLAIAQADDVEERVGLFEAGADEVVARPFDPRELEARLTALQLRLAGGTGTTPQTIPAEQEPPAHRVIALFSPKGGTGTTTIAVNVALAIAHQRPGAVAIIDLDTQFGQVVTYLLRNVNPRRTLAQLVGDEPALDDPDLLRSYATTVEPGLHVFPAPSSPAHAELVTKDAVGRLLRTARVAYEDVVVDAGSHLDETTLEVFDLADSVIVVMRPEMAALRAVLSLIDYLGEIGALGSRMIYVVNHLFAREMVKLRDIEEVLGTRVAVEIPHDQFIFLRAVNEGVPVVRAAPKSTPAQRLARLAALSMGSSRTGERRSPDGGRRLIGGLRLSR